MKDSLLTSKTYWEKYYSHSHAKREHIIHVCGAYDDYWDKLFSNITPEKKLIEIGGYPGRYLAYIGNKYDIHTTCLDYNSDITQIENCYKAMGVENYKILIEDFTKFVPKRQYDYVISNGFIEHFDNYDHILDLHCQYLKPGGKMLVMIPNKRYFRKFYGYLCDYRNLTMHNLKCMSLRVFNDFANRNKLKVSSLNYYGGFPYSVHQKLNIFQKIIYKIVRQIFRGKINNYIMKNPNKLFSSTIIGIYEKPLN